MYVADKVEWPMLVAAIVPKRCPINCHRIDFVGRIKNENIAKTFAFQASYSSLLKKSPLDRLSLTTAWH